ncbi:YncE family protein [Ferrimicrobium acidiphilum]|uniref:YncE family protein n=1 Tax=Ferrimicrobium acidiphilum TaxID=121039 RepID=UPI0023F0CA2C|nr:YncE family protein [Ferrimicrobium acidiphilum]
MAVKGSPTARSAALVRLVRIVGIVVAICMFFGIADSGVSWAATPAIRSIRAIKKGASSFFALEGLAVNPETNTVYTTDGLELFVINGANDKVTHTLHVDSFGLGVDPVTGMLYVTNGKTVSVINGATDRVVDTIDVKYGAVFIAVNPSTNTVYVTSGKTVSVINGATDRVTHAIHLGAHVFAIAMNPTTNTLYVGLSENSYATYFGQAAANRLAVINGATDRVTRTIDLSSQAAQQLAVNPTTNTVYVGGNSIFVINGATDKVTDQLFVSGLMTVNPATNTVYVNNGKAVSVINGATDKVTSTLHVKSAGIGFAVNQTTNTVYSSDGDFVSAISFGNPSHSVVSGDSIWLAVVGLVVVGGGSALINVSKRRRLDAQQADEDGTPPQRYQRRR